MGADKFEKKAVCLIDKSVRIVHITILLPSGARAAGCGPPPPAWPGSKSVWMEGWEMHNIHRTILLTSAVLLVLALPAAAITVLYQSENTSIHINPPMGEVELQNPLVGNETVRDWVVDEWRDADYSSDPWPTYGDWDVYTAGGHVGGTATRVTMQYGGQSMWTQMLSDCAAVSIHLHGDTFGGIAQILLDGVEEARIDMNTSSPVDVVVLIVRSTYGFVEVKDLGPGIGGEYDDHVSVYGAAGLRSGQLVPGYNHIIPNHGWAPCSDQHNEMISLWLTALGEPAELDTITLQASGTGDDALGISSVRLWGDVNDNGVAEPGVDFLFPLVEPCFYQSDNGTLVLEPEGKLQVDLDQSIPLLITYTMANPPPPNGNTFQFSVTRVAGTGKRSYAPVEWVAFPGYMPSAVKQVGPPGLSFARRRTIPNHEWQPGDDYNEMISLSVAACGDIRWNSITLQASGTGNDAVDIASVKAWKDVDDDGLVDPGTDQLLGSGVYPSDNGTLVMNLSPPPVIYACPPEVPILISYTMSGKVAQPGSLSYSFRVTGASGVDLASGKAAVVNIPPSLTSAIKYISLPAIVFERNHNIPDHTWWWWPSCAADEMISFKATADSEPIQWNKITLKASGTGDDAGDIASVDIWIDQDDNGIADPGVDSLIGSGTYASDNGLAEIVLDPPQFITSISTNVLITHTIARPVVEGKTFHFDLVGVSGTGVGSALPAVLCLRPPDMSSATVRIEQPYLSVARNHSTLDHFWYPNPDQYNEMICLAVTANSDDIRWETLSLLSSGSGNDAADIQSVGLWLDVNDNGSVEVGTDQLIGSGSYNSDNGSLTISVGSGGLIIPKSQTVKTVISYTMRNSIALCSVFQFRVTGASGTALNNGLGIPTRLSPDPLYSARKVVVPLPITIGEAKKLAVGDLVFLESKTVTSDLSSSMSLAYVQEEDRSAGIGVLGGLPPGIVVGDRVSLLGRTGNCGYELVFDLEELMFVSKGELAKPIALGNKATGGGAYGHQLGVADYVVPGKDTVMATGLNNVGMLIRTWGRATGYCGDIFTGGIPVYVGTMLYEYFPAFWVDDGSRLLDGSYDVVPTGVSVGVAVLCPPGFDPPTTWPSGFWTVTGIVRVTPGLSGSPIRILVPRNEADIVRQ